MIPDESISRALDWLVSNADKAAAARATRVYLEEFRKSLKAQIMSEHKDKPIGAQEREAYSDPRYTEHLTALRHAVADDEKMRWLLAAAEARIEAWRTANANERAKGKIA